MKEEFTLTKPRPFWLISLAVGAVGSAIIFPFRDTHPWLIIVPIAVGSTAVVLEEISPTGFFAWVRPKEKVSTQHR
jgi:hypothetical protein